jgi:hypothetical protein
MSTRYRETGPSAGSSLPWLRPAVELGELMAIPAWLWARLTWSAVRLLDRPAAVPGTLHGKDASAAHPRP